MIKKYKITHVRELENLAGEILSAGDYRIYALSGNLGAGKTTFIKALCRHLGSTDIIQSPTFALIHEYISGTGDPVYHMDFYRIRKIDEVFDLGYEDYFFSGYYCFIEWPEKIEILLPTNTVNISIENMGGNNREITVHYPG